MPVDLDDQAFLETLARFDELSRPKRLARHKWLAPYCRKPGIYQASVETIELMEQARVSYVNGQFIAALMLATAFIEHTLADELASHGLLHKRKNGLTDLTKAAAGISVFPEDLLEATNSLGKLRNPYVHWFDPDSDHRYPDTLSSRFRPDLNSGRSSRHPQEIMEEDAQVALKLMYEYFNLTLKHT